ncbi:MAG: energy-coupling factor transporter transmembrane component T [Clostridium sp.]|nr:energy-coupling factor transporter transmembrane component T [Clostridium sp.]
MINSFENYHPLVNFYYFSFVIVCSMFFMHPIFLIISLTSAFIYSVVLKGRRALKFNILYMLPLMLITALINPAFNHEGVTILFYLKGGNPITLESIVYGIVAATMFISVIVWFSCYNEIMTSDKFIYLWGRIIPSLSLIFSMVLRFVPKYKAQIKVISNAQKAIGRDVTKGNIIRRARNGIKILSIMVTWALENAVETADSMKARGYGLKGRTSFSNFKFSKRDKIVLFLMIVLSLIVIIGVLMKVNRIRYFPRIKIARNTIFTIIVDISYFLFCIMPIILTVIDEIRWKRINK